MDAVSYSLASKQAQRIEKFIENPDSSSGIVTVPKVIGAGENVTVPAGRVAVLPNVQVDGTLNVEGEVFIPSGATLSKVVELEGDQTISDIKTFLDSPIVPTPTTGTQAVNKNYTDGKVSKTEVAYNIDTSSFIPNTLASGAIIERGSNANGEYVKFADGTLIMSKEIDFATPSTFTGTAGSRYKIIDWTFPYISSINPYVIPSGGQNATVEQTLGNILICSQRRNSINGIATKIIAREIRSSQETTQVTASVVAISKWK